MSITEKQRAKLDALKAKTRAKIIMGGCHRCGRTREDKSHVHCARCRTYFRQRRRATDKQLFDPNAASKCELERLTTRLERLERRFEDQKRANLLAYKRGWYMGARAAAKKLTAETPADFAPVNLSFEEAAQMSHVYQQLG